MPLWGPEIQPEGIVSSTVCKFVGLGLWGGLVLLAVGFVGYSEGSFLGELIGVMKYAGAGCESA